MSSSDHEVTPAHGGVPECACGCGEGVEAVLPDALGRVLEVSTMVSVFEADRLRRVSAFRDDGFADIGRYGVAPEIVERSLRLELAAAMRVTEYSAGELLDLADAVVHRYPRALDALEGDRVTLAHVKVLVTALDTLEPLLRDDLVDEAIALAEAQPVGVFRRTLRARIEQVCGDTLAERHAVALAQRRVAVEAGRDGMATLWAQIPAVEAHAIFGRVTAIAKQIIAQPAESRTLDQVRADVLCDLAIDGKVAAHPKAARGIRAEVVVTVPVLSLLDTVASATDTTLAPAPTTGTPATTAGAPGPTLNAGTPGQLVGTSKTSTGTPGSAKVDLPVVEGVGPIPVDRARELCGGNASWMRVLTHPETGMVLSVGRDRYSPPRSLRKLTTWRADRCMAPGCHMPASRCQIDHTLAWCHGGHTSLENNCPMCQGHHTVKHHGGWIVRQVPGSGGVIEWTSPTGRRYLVEPERRVPAFRAAPTPQPATPLPENAPF